MKKANTGLHLLLVVGIFLYLYSPLLDHWFGFEFHSRPHAHAHVAGHSVQAAHDDDAVSAAHPQHEEGVLCLLDIDLLPVLLLPFNAAHGQLAPHDSLVFESFLSYLHVSIIYLSSLDPPPNS